MGKTAKAFLGTEGKTTYRDCDVCYYTYNISNKPKSFFINVNVSLKDSKYDYIMTLAIDKSFASEQEAISYGIAQGEKYIDRYLTKSKIKSV